jgi:subtilase family serine protease
MPRLDRNRRRSCRSPLNVEGLEERQLLNAARVTPDAVAKGHSHTTVRLQDAGSTARPLVSIAEAFGRMDQVVSSHHFALKIVRVRSRLLSDYIIVPQPPVGGGIGEAAFSPPPTAYTPSQIRTAYGLNLLPTSNQGQGVTIGIVDQLIDPTIASDVAAFSTQFGLPQLDGLNGDGKLTTINDTALGNPGVSPPGDTSIETALDVEWAHAMAPLANIDLIFVPNNSNTLPGVFAQILHGVQLAAQQPGVVAVSTSYGFFEGNLNVPGLGTIPGFTAAQEQSLNTTYLAPGTPASNVALTFSTGDYSLPLFPAVSPNVIAVGGTSLSTATARGRYGFEVGWGGISQNGAGGGGVSTAFGLPAFQSGAGLSFSGRAVPDISMDADPQTGVPVYSQNDAPINGGDPWFQIGGTSLSSPMFAGVIALAQQNRIAASQPILNSVQIDTALYNAYVNNYATYFHDIVLGNNNDIDEGRFIFPINIPGHNATTGYDLATGIGSPIANILVGLLSST